jgi:hypothetical protein
MPRRSLPEDDPMVILLNDLKNCKNRKEKRKLLAKYNKTVGFAFGEKRIISKKYNNNYEKDDEDKNENYKEKFEKNIYKENLKDKNKNNTTVISRKTFERVSRLDNEKIVDKFSQKISLKNSKIKALQSQANLSLLLSNESENKSTNFVNIPGKDYNKVVNYLSSFNGENKIKSFEEEITKST